MKRSLFFSLVIVFTGIIFAPVSLSPCVQTEAKTISVSLMKKVPLPRPFFRLPSHQTLLLLWCGGLEIEREVWIRNYVPKEGAETSTGKKAEWGIIAVDPKKIPLGSIVLIPEFPDQEFVAEDTGDFSGWKIDLCRDAGYSLKLAKKFGKKKMRITIIKPFA